MIYENSPAERAFGGLVYEWDGMGWDGMGWDGMGRRVVTKGWGMLYYFFSESIFFFWF